MVCRNIKPSNCTYINGYDSFNMKFELAYNDVAVLHVSHYATGISFNHDDNGDVLQIVLSI